MLATPLGCLDLNDPVIGVEVYVAAVRDATSVTIAEIVTACAVRVDLATEAANDLQCPRILGVSWGNPHRFNDGDIAAGGGGARAGERLRPRVYL
jgi:hypothetical protein